MSEMTGSEIYAQLVGLRNNAGALAYDRIALADRLLKDRAWVESPSGGGGDENKALDRLEADCFADLCGIISLPQLLEIYCHVPDAAVWKKHKFNLRAIWADWKARQKPQMKKNVRPERGEATKPFTPPLEFPELTPGKAKAEYERAYRTIESDAQKIARLEQENKELREENERLKAENTRLRNGVKDLLKVG